MRQRHDPNATPASSPPPQDSSAISTGSSPRRQHSPLPSERVQSLTPSTQSPAFEPHRIRLPPPLAETVGVTNTANMSLLTLPHEVQDEILFNLVLGYTGDYNRTFMVRTEVVPYILANRSALDCWRASRRLIAESRRNTAASFH